MRRLATPILMSLVFSAATDAALLKRDVEYGRAGDISLRMDIRTPSGTGPFPAVILVHGGGWIRGDRTWNLQPLFEPFSNAGFVTFSISYRLATDFLEIGVAVDDVLQAIHYIREHAAEYHVSPDQTGLLGESAGAHLAMLAALQEPRSVAAFVGMYSPSDLEELGRTSPAVPEQVRQAILNSAFAGLMVAHLRSLSPIDKVRPDAPPFLLIHGTADRIVPFSQSTKMQERMRSMGASCELISIPGGGHGMRFWDGAPSQSAWLKQMLSWLQTKLNVSAPQTRRS